MVFAASKGVSSRSETSQALSAVVTSMDFHFSTRATRLQYTLVNVNLNLDRYIRQCDSRLQRSAVQPCGCPGKKDWYENIIIPAARYSVFLTRVRGSVINRSNNGICLQSGRKIRMTSLLALSLFGLAVSVASAQTRPAVDELYRDLQSDGKTDQAAAQLLRIARSDERQQNSRPRIYQC